jgi:putative addiction module component (TIGR02574 family)
MSNADTILSEALALPIEDRARLVLELSQSLEPAANDDMSPEEWEAAWAAEARRRLVEVRAGRSASAGEVIARVRSRLQERRQTR